MSKAIGIDLGTTFSAAAVVDDHGRPIILPNDQGAPITPSVIYLGQNPPLFGDEAKQMQALGEEDTAYLFKRNMGDPNFSLDLAGKSWTPTDLSALLLEKLKADAEAALGSAIEKAVITVPAYFDNHQREATIEAGQRAGLTVLRVINEPTAAALSYGYGRGEEDGTLLIYDLGGGTFDVTIVRITAQDIEVLGTDGDSQLGGRDWDDRIAVYLAQCFEDEYGVNPLDDSESAGDLLVRCETAKKHLSTRESTRVTLTHHGERGAYPLSRERFENLTEDLMERSRRLTEQALADVGLDWRNLDGVLLVGGSTRMPMVQRFVTEMSGKTPRTGVNVDEAVALGAAIQASRDTAPGFTLTGSRKITDVMSHSLGMVAVSEDRKRFLNSIIIPKNKAIPCRETRPFQHHMAYGKDTSEVYMLQGELDDPTHCTVLGRYVFSGIVRSPGPCAVLDISYAYDTNGMVAVTAEQREPHKKLDLVIETVPEDMSWLSQPPDEVHAEVGRLSVVFAIDLSGSMWGEPLKAAQAAARTFIGKLDLGHTSVALVGFANKVGVSQGLCQNAKTLTQGVDKWNSWMSNGELGGGNLGQPFTVARELLADVDGVKFLIVLTDGVWTNQNKAIQAAQKAAGTGVEIVALGFGHADRNFLRKIATSDENAVFTDLSKLSSSFSKIAQVLTETGGVQTKALSFFNQVG